LQLGEATGDPNLILADEKGVKRFGVDCGAAGARVSLHGPTGDAYSELCRDGNKAVFRFLGADAKPRLLLSVDPADSKVGLFDPHGHPRGACSPPGLGAARRPTSTRTAGRSRRVSRRNACVPLAAACHGK
jgi:hypothetical protein